MNPVQVDPAKMSQLSQMSPEKYMVEKCLYLRCAPDSLVVFTWLVFGLEHTFMSTYYYAHILKSTI